MWEVVIKIKETNSSYFYLSGAKPIKNPIYYNLEILAETNIK